MDPSRPPEGGLSYLEIALLLATQRLAFGSAHAMNNAFTAILGETGFLLGARKDDPEILEACAVIRDEIARCARMTHTLLGGRRRADGVAGAHDADLVRVVRTAVRALADTLGRRIALEVALPDDLLMVRGDAAELEVLVLLFVHQAADQADGCARIALRTGRDEIAGETWLALALRPEGGAFVGEADAAAGILARTFREIAAALGAELRADGAGPDERVWRLVLRSGA